MAAFTFDAWTAAAVVAELLGAIIPGRVQGVLQTDTRSYALEIYARGKRHYLLLSADPKLATAQLWPEKLRRGNDAPSPLLLQMRKRLRGAALLSVEQPPFERLLFFSFEHPQQGKSVLMAEVMGRHSNLLLLNGEKRILTAVKQVGPGRNRWRSTLPGAIYTPPPPLQHPLPWQLNAEMVSRWIAEAPDVPFWRLLVQNASGVSPLFAQEISCRSAGRETALAKEVASEKVIAVLTALLDRWSNNRWQPTIAVAGDRVLAAAPYPLDCAEETAPLPSMSLALARWRQSLGAGDPYRAQRGAVAGEIAVVRRRLTRLQGNLQQEIAAKGEMQRWRLMGDWLLASASRVKAGQKELPVETEQGPLIIPLEPTLSPVENAQRYYRRYRKAKRALEVVPPHLRQVQRDLAYLDQLSVDLQEAENAPQIAGVEQALAAMSGYKRPRKITPDHSGPRQFHTAEGYVVWVGRNARQNEMVTFHQASPDDTWFHARNLPGAHVVLRNGGRPVTPETRQQVADLAAHFSSGRGEALVEVQTCRVRDVKRMPGGHPGQVILRREEVLSARPRIAPGLQKAQE